MLSAPSRTGKRANVAHHDPAKSARPTSALSCARAYCVQREAREFYFDARVREERAVLRDERSAHVRENAPQVCG